MFEVIPAIDVKDGALAHLTPTGLMRIDAFDGDPVAAAAAMVEAGATRLHVVDMDLAFDGEPGNLDVVSAIVSLRAQVQAGGGVRTAEAVDALLSVGVARVVLGSAALANEVLARALLDMHGPRLIVGIEVGDGGTIRSRGRDPVDLPLMETLGWLSAAHARGFPRHGGGQGGFVDRTRPRSREAGQCAPAARCSPRRGSAPSTTSETSGRPGVGCGGREGRPRGHPGSRRSSLDPRLSDHV